MTIRAIDGSGDWMLGKGKQNYLTENLAIGENIQTRLLFFFNDCFFDYDNGIDWFRLLGSKSTEQEILLNVRTVILQSFGVLRINSLSVTENENRNLLVEYNIDTIYTENVSESLEVASYAESN